ncbi:hypothetical protein MPER_08337 [Moniliophthora perniciosa FA553]|nr:hypothetical protein MPER_08337 [Moniliophthora perniciosa FA553]
MAMDTEPGEWQKECVFDALQPRIDGNKYINSDNDELRPPEVNASATAPGNPIIVGMPTNDEVDMLDDGELQYPNGADDDDGKHSNADPSSFSDHSHDESIGIANELLDIESSSNGSPVSRRPHLQVDLSRLQHPGYNELPTPTSLLDENLHSADTEPAIDHLEQLDRAAFSNVSLEDGEIRERASSRASNDRGLTSEALGAINALPLEPEEGELTERRPPSTINPPVVPSPISPPAGRNFIMKYTEPKRKRRRKVENDPEPGPVSKKRRVNAVSNAKSANAPPASPDSPRFELPFSSSSAGPRDLGNSFPGPSRPRVIKTVTLDYMIEWVNMLTRLNYLVDRGQAVRTDEQKLTTTLEEVIAGTEDIVYALRDQVQAWRSGKGRWNQGKPSQAQKLVEVLQDHKSHSVWGEVVREEIANLLDYFCKEVRELEDMLGLYC